MLTWRPPLWEGFLTFWYWLKFSVCNFEIGEKGDEERQRNSIISGLWVILPIFLVFHVAYLSVYYIHFSYFSLCKLQSSIYYFRIFNRVLFSYFVCVLCTRSRSHWCASLLHIKLFCSSWSLWSKNSNYMLFHHFFPKIPSSLPNFSLSLCVSSELC